MKKIFPLTIIVLLIFSSLKLDAQTPFIGFEHNHQFFWTQTIYNPAYAGHESQPTFYAVSQLGRANFDTAPQLYNVAWQTSVDNLGFALIANYSNLDPNNSTRMGLIAGQFSLEFDAFDSFNAKAGLGFGALHYNNEVVDPTNPNASTTMQVENNVPFARYNADIGILLYNDNFRLGISLIHNNEPEFNFFNTEYIYQNFNGGISSFDPTTVFRNRNYITFAYDIYSGDLKFTPSIFTRVYALTFDSTNRRRTNSNDNFRLDANLTASLREEFFLGASYIKDVNYIGSVNAAYRTIGGFQVSASFSIPKAETPEGFLQFELGLGWFPQWEDDDDEEYDDTY